MTAIFGFCVPESDDKKGALATVPRDGHAHETETWHYFRCFPRVLPSRSTIPVLAISHLK